MDRGTNYGGELVAGLKERGIKMMVEKILNLSFFSRVRYPEKENKQKKTSRFIRTFRVYTFNEFNRVLACEVVCKSKWG